MAARNTTTRNSGEQPKCGKCYDCANAYLMRSQPYNPIVALCEKTNERWVASMDPRCGLFIVRVGEAEIHPMIHLYKHE